MKELLNDALLNRKLADSIENLGIPGASISLMLNNKWYSAVAGYANIPEQIKVNDKTVFQIGSTSKVFTSTLIMKLVEENKLNLEQPVSDFLPDLEIENKPLPKNLTVRSLLDFSAGIEGDVFDDFGDDEKAIDKYLSSLKDIQYIHQPGEMRSYNSTSYVIAGKLVEIITGLTYVEAIEEILFKPLGISDYSFYDLDNLDYQHTAVGHLVTENGFQIVDQIRMPYVLAAAGSLISLTSIDLLKFGEMHINNGKADSGVYLSETSTIDLRRSHKTVPPNNSDLILGWAHLNSNKGKLIVASGATYGQNSFLILSPDEKVGISVLANRDNGAQDLTLTLGIELLREFANIDVEIPDLSLPESKPVDLPDDLAEKIIGKYVNGPEVEIFKENDQLKSRVFMNGSDTGQHSTLTYLGDNKFGVMAEGTTNIQLTVEFIFTESSERASNLFLQSRLFGRKI